MEKKKVEYGTTHDVIVESVSPKVIIVVSPEIKEGFILMGHGMDVLPNVGDKGKIVFEKGGIQGGYWKLYTNETNKPIK